MKGSCSADVVLATVQQGQQQHRCNVYQSCAIVAGSQQPDIRSVTRDDTEKECCGRVCSTRPHSSLRGSVSFCSIECVLATKFCGEARIHEISKTQKSFKEIPRRNDLIRLLVSFKYFLNLNLGNMVN